MVTVNSCPFAPRRWPEHGRGGDRTPRPVFQLQPQEVPAFCPPAPPFLVLILLASVTFTVLIGLQDRNTIVNGIGDGIKGT